MADVQDHYGSADIVPRVLAAVPWGVDGEETLEADQLFPFDQLHGGELRSTIAHAARMKPQRSAEILDIGSGIGGPARYFATKFGCSVTGIDVTAQFVSAATELSRLCALSELTRFVEGDAASLPFEEARFDHAYCFYVGMNLSDRNAILRECARVLKPGGMLLWTEVVGAGGCPYYPLPWSVSAEMSHIGNRTDLLTAMHTAGFVITAVEDESDALVEGAEAVMRSGRVPSVGHRQANEVVLGADFAERRRNFVRSLADDRLASILIEARTPT